MKKINKIFASIIALTILVPAVVFSATIKTGENISITKTIAEENLYLSGKNITINNNVEGDLLVAAGTILVSKDVANDLIIAGGNITLLGKVGDDARVAGGNITISNEIAGELVVAGGHITISENAKIEKDLMIFGRKVIINGEVNGDVFISGGSATINGHIKGNVKSKIYEKLILGEKAIIDGTLTYSWKTADILQKNKETIVNGKIIFEDSGFSKNKNYILGLFFKIIIFIITALIFVGLFKKFSNLIVNVALTSPLKILAKGFVALIIIPVISILLFISILGTPIALIILFFYILLVLIAMIYTAIIFGVWLCKIIRKKEIEITWQGVVAGVVILILIKLIPIIGHLIVFLIFLIALWSLVEIFYKKVWSGK